MACEVQFPVEIEDPGPPLARIGVRLKEDRFEVPQFPRDPCHLRAVETGGVRENSKAVAAVGMPREDIDVVVAHDRDPIQRQSQKERASYDYPA